MIAQEIQPFQTTFAVPLHCNSCIQDVSDAVNKLDGKLDGDAVTKRRSLNTSRRD